MCYLDVVSLTHTGPEGDEGAWQIREATAFSCLLRDTAGKDTGHEGGTETYELTHIQAF